MTDASTTQPRPTDVLEPEGHGKHRGQTSSHDGETAPAGRHRKPAGEQTEVAA
ncbi:hypothetical protein [Streptomyces sp. PsTaAH-124]|uniref:hypothetical protein n=1 Tax=Streptomyces sp. PsTaAH-124 TaxID=1157638 RepID=UPI000380D397|nr:hypothetical protein [Streptomyces sp. PsTaAH-124]